MQRTPEILKPQVIEKNWGRERIFISTNNYCFKTLEYDYAGNFSSFHAHIKSKVESWLVHSGSFKLEYFEEGGIRMAKTIRPGDVIHIELGCFHKLTALENNSIIYEVSTFDDQEDIVRVEPSMSDSPL